MKSFRISLFTILLITSVFGFGKNKVQYQKLNWSFINASHFSLYFHQGQGQLPRLAYPWFNAVYDELSSKFKFSHDSPVPVIVYESPALFQQTNIITELLPEEVGGFTELFKNRVALPFNGSLREFRHVLHHEMVHAFVFGILYEGKSLFKGATSQVPLWFNEGLAEFLSSGWDKEADMFMMDRVIHSTVPLPGPGLNGYLAYKGGQSFLYYLYSIEGDSTFQAMLEEFKASKSAENAIEKVYGKKLDKLGKEWIRELRRIYWPEIGLRAHPTHQAHMVTSRFKRKSRFNLHPRVSPDGSKIAFFSDLKDYTSILITDKQGKILQEISQNGYGGFFESFQPFRSGICWSPDSKSLAFVTKDRGRNQIRIVDVEKKKLKKALTFPFSALSSPHWSKTGTHLTFTAVENGQSDIYVYNLNTSKHERITHTIEVESNPRFSPDGKQIIFALQDTAGFTEGFSPGNKSSGSNLAVYDFKADSVKTLTYTEWNDKQPVFSPEGSKVLFVSDRNGIDNLYIASIDSINDSRPLTNYIGGCSNPDWSAQGDKIVFDHFMNQAWNIFLMEKPLDRIPEDTLAHTVWAKHEKDTTSEFFTKKQAVCLSENDRDTTKSQPALSDSTSSVGAESDTLRKDIHTRKDSGIVIGLADQESKTDSLSSASMTFPDPQPYRLRFTPDMMMFGLGLNTFSGMSGQWLVMLSDIMGDHRVAAAGDMQAQLDEYIHIYLAYQYLRHRIDFSAGGYYNKDYTYDGLFRYLYHDSEMGGFLGLSYPFSLFARADFEVYGRHIKRVPVNDEENESEQPGKTLYSSVLLPSLSFTFDNILWGITGPLNGFRGEAEVMTSPPLSFVDEPFLAGDIDLRHYTHISKKFVWANRITAGASVPLEKGNSARRYLLGGSENWFNYNVNRTNYENTLPFSFYSKVVSPLRGWDYLDLTGDRTVLVNSEFRFPFIREISTVWPLAMQIRYINGALFVDAGNAWSRSDQESWVPLPPKLYGGIGFGMRANLGIFVLRYDRGWPTDWKKITGPPINYFSLGAEF